MLYTDVMIELEKHCQFINAEIKNSFKIDYLRKRTQLMYAQNLDPYEFYQEGQRRFIERKSEGDETEKIIVDKIFNLVAGKAGPFLLEIKDSKERLVTFFSFVHFVWQKIYPDFDPETQALNNETVYGFTKRYWEKFDVKND